MRDSKRRARCGGFTLIELLVTTAIVGILIGLVLGISGLATKKSDESKARAEMQKIANAIEEYRVAYGDLPPDLNTLKNATKLSAELRDFKVTDPWGRNYQYARQSRYGYSLSSQGPKVADAADDIASGSF